LVDIPDEEVPLGTPETNTETDTETDTDDDGDEWIDLDDLPDLVELPDEEGPILSETPQTGDDVVIWIALAGAAAISLLGLAFPKKKAQDEEQQ
jgi:LPXTG-motif cell wall-anchored protein